jgi:hypothetical protein
LAVRKAALEGTEAIQWFGWRGGDPLAFHEVFRHGVPEHRGAGSAGIRREMIQLREVMFLKVNKGAFHAEILRRRAFDVKK